MLQTAWENPQPKDKWEMQAKGNKWTPLCVRENWSRFYSRNSLQHSYFLMVYIRIFRVIKFLDVFLMTKPVSFFFWGIIQEAHSVFYSLLSKTRMFYVRECIYKIIYLLKCISAESFIFFISLLLYMLPLMSQCNTEIKNIELQSRHLIRKQITSL